MEKWTISKEFEFDYAHRVWVQKLDGYLSNNSSCACRHIHGHRGKITVYLSATELNTESMVIDFKNLTWLKNFIDNTIDHKFIIDKNDPLLKDLLPTDAEIYEYIHFKDYSLISYKGSETHKKELYDGLVVINNVPTSENLSKWFYDMIQEVLNVYNIKVEKVDFYETPKTKSSYGSYHSNINE